MEAGSASSTALVDCVRVRDNADYMAQVFVSERVVLPDGVRPAAVRVEGQRIVAVERAGGPNDLAARPLAHEGDTVHQLGELALLPGLVDTHVHINEPGRTEWEGFRTATRAAAAGGFTTLVDMPLNCLPETTTVEALEAKRAAAAGQCMVDWAAWGGAVEDNREHLLPLARAGVPGYKCFLIYPGCDGFTSISRAHLEEAAPVLAETGLPLLVHAEFAGPIDAAVQRLNVEGADWRAYATYLASRPDAAELEAIEWLIDLCRTHRFRLHIVHLATALALPMLRAAKDEGLPVTVETCPHYLYAAAEEIPDGATLWKCAPPIRSRENREALWQALRDGTIDLVATDHSPCPPQMKRAELGRLDLAWGGIASLSVALPVLWTRAAEHGANLADVARWMSAAPAQLAGFDTQIGSITPGRLANFVVFDHEAEQTISAERLHTRHAISPYVGERLRGVVRTTWLRGSCVYRRSEDGLELFAAPEGRELALC
jgi:allantoinase